MSMHKLAQRTRSFGDQRRSLRPDYVLAGPRDGAPYAFVASMGRLLVICLALGLAGPTRAFGAPDKIDTHTLSAKEVAKYFAPYVPDVRSCYLTNAKSRGATGVLRLELVIHHNGSVHRFGFAAPGVTNPWKPRLDACLRKLSKTWTFPLRKGFTSAVIPFVYLKTNDPKAGPFETCTDPKGCGPRKSGGKR
jgi:hypothetical protein